MLLELVNAFPVLIEKPALFVDPAAVVLIPPQRLVDASFEGGARFPAQSLQLFAADRITEIVSGAVFDELDERPGLAQFFQKFPGRREIVLFEITADIIDLPRFAFAENKMDRL